MDFEKKEYVAYMLLTVLPLMAFFGLTYLKILVWLNSLIVAMALCIILSLFVKTFVFNDAFFLILRKKGLGVLNFDSSGIIKMYICKVRMPYVDLKIGNSFLTTIFDRRLAVPFLRPKIVDAVDYKDNITITIPKEDYAKNVFSWNGINVFLYNSKIQNFITKEMLADQESKITVEHAILQLLERITTLHNNIAQFYRYVVDKALKKDGLGNFNWGIIIIIILIVILLFVFNQPILEFLQKFAGGLSGGVAKTTGAIQTPIK